jgi:hypothetical protein
MKIKSLQAMIKKEIVLLIIGLYFTINFAKGQSYGVKSLEGNKVNINLFYKSSSGMLTISYLRDTILINDYMSVDTVIVLNKMFLQISYVKRAGSNEDAMNLLLLYVYNGRLCQALHVNSLNTYDIRPNEYSLFKLRTTLSGHNVDTYRLTVNIYNEKSSKHTPKSNYKYNKIGVLTFDKKNKVFCSNYEHITGYYTFHNLIDKGNRKTYLKNDLPVVKIEKDKYYYIWGNWFTKNKSDFYSMLL